MFPARKVPSNHNDNILRGPQVHAVPRVRPELPEGEVRPAAPELMCGLSCYCFVCGVYLFMVSSFLLFSICVLLIIAYSFIPGLWPQTPTAPQTGRKSALKIKLPKFRRTSCIRNGSGSSFSIFSMTRELTAARLAEPTLCYTRLYYTILYYTIRYDTILSYNVL